MNRICHHALAVLATFLFGASAANLSAATFSDANWVSMGGYPGANGTVSAAVVDSSGNLYIGGSFTVVGDVFASYVAKWNGTNWSALGSGMNGAVFALAVAGGNVYAGGYFTTAGGRAANYIAKWDGTNWSALGSGMNSTVSELAVSGSDLYAGGAFTTADGSAANYIAKWNGSSWTPLGSGMSDTVSALAVSGSDLYAGGSFTRAGGSAADYIARWNGSNWVTLGSGVNGSVFALAASGSDLYAGGYFTTAGGSAAWRIAKWNGSSWIQLPSGWPGGGGGVFALAVSGSDLYAGGYTTAGDSTVPNIAKWNGSSWSALSSGMGGYDGSVSALVVLGSDLYAAGYFTTAGGRAANYIAKWDGSNWSPLGSGLNAQVSALAVAGSDLYAGGAFTTADGSPANYIAKRTGSSWSAVGSGMNGPVSALAASGSNLYAGGQFTTAGGSPANYIAKWNGSGWSALGAGMNSNVLALAVSGTDLYAAGQFTTAGGSAANYIAKWNGSSWSPLGSGMNDAVYALAVLGSDLYVGGYFTNADGSAANYVAKWDGSSWSALGSGMGGGDDYPYVYSLVMSGSDLYAGGGFTTAGGNPADHIAKWNGSSWSALGSGMQGNDDYWADVYALVVSGNDLYAGGTFRMAGGNSANYIAKWNGSSWSRLGSGLNGAVMALAMSGSELYAGGYFTTAGTKVSAYVARADLDLPTEPPFVDVTATVAPGLPALASSSVAWADYDNDGRLDFLLTGDSFSGLPISQIWRNTGSGFTNVTATVAPGLPGVSGGSVAWGDFDNDGRLDFLLTGYAGYSNGSSILVSQLWRNTGSTFTNVTATVAPDLPGVSGGSVAWGDFDNDGRLDFLLTGFAGYIQPNWVPIFVSQVWRNTGSGFTNVTATVAPGLPGVVSGSVAWGDYDNDGRLDFLLTGGIPRRSDQDDYTPLSGISQLWRNTGSGFVNVTDAVAPGLPGVFWSSVAWADYDNDGWPDFLLTGFTGWDSTAKSVSQLWHNTGNGFVNVTDTVAPGLPGTSNGSVAWGDYDNDGRLDFLLGGPGSQLWRNTGSGFTNVTASVAPGLPPLIYSSVAWGDYDNDGRLDLLLTGAVDGYCDVCDPPPRTSQLWRNNTAQTNSPPAVITKVPTSATQTSVVLNASVHPHQLASAGWFIWGESTNCCQVTAAQPMGNGHSFTNFSETITGLSPGVTYYYRAVASNALGVVVGVEQHFVLAPTIVTTTAASFLLPTSAILNGKANPNNLPTYGWFEWGLTPAYGQVTPVQFLGAGFDIGVQQSLSGLASGHTYYFRPVFSNILGVVYGQAGSFSLPIFANVTAAVAPGLLGIHYGPVGWIDYDNDGRLDFLIAGGDYNHYSELWRNTGNGFTEEWGPLRRTAFSCAWGDYDNDGWLDVLSTGRDDWTWKPYTELRRNTGSGFVNVTATIAPGLPQVMASAVVWADYDNDGRLDFLLAGSSTNGYISQLWRNTGSGFTNVTATVAPGLPEVVFSVVWADYDNDGWLDFFLTGATNGEYVSQLWRNTGGRFTNVTATVAPGLPGIVYSVAWADYDNDGWLDFLLTGSADGEYVSQLWRNTGGVFTNVTATVAPGLPGLSGPVAWGDYDNDGRLDVLISGRSANGEYTTQIWRNTESGFEDVTDSVAPDLRGIGGNAVAWGDYDNDGRLDILLAGNNGQEGSYDENSVQLWRNYTSITNTPPSAPNGLAMTSSSNAVMLSWNSATDDQTPASGLTYNVRAGTTPGGNDLLSAHVNATNGFRRVPAMGNAMLRHSLPLTGLTNGQTVYWSVQAVDTSFAGGPFATETSVVSLPQLRITRPDATNAIVSWDPPTFGWVLQQNTYLSVSNWTATANDSANPASLSATNGTQFYRLSKP